MTAPPLRAVKRTGQAPPHSVAAEQNVLGAVFVDETVLPVIMRSGLTVMDFYREAHQAIFKAMCTLYDDQGGPVDLLTVSEQMKRDGTLNRVGGPAYLSELSDCVATTANTQHYVKIIIEKAELRRVIKTAEDAAAAARAPDARPALVIARASERLDEIHQRDRVKTFITAENLLTTKYETETPVIGKGILPAGGSWIIAGESGAGKSMLRLEMGLMLALGHNLWGLKVPKARRVFIVQFENVLPTEKARLQRMLTGLNIEGYPRDLLFSDPTIRLDFKLKSHWADALEMVKQSEADVVIWDPLSSLAASVDENNNGEMRRVLDAITEINRKTNSSSIVIHHFGKPSQDQNAAHRARGASSVRDWCDTMAHLLRKPNEHRILRTLEFVKVRNGPEHRPILLERTENFLHIQTEDDMKVTPGQVRETLNAMGGTVRGQVALSKAIEEKHNCSERSARTYIREAVKMKAIREIKDGKTFTYNCHQ